MKIKNIVFITLFTILILFISIVVYQKIILNKNIIKINGYSILRVASGSMQPTLNINDIIIIKESDNYKTNDIVTVNKGTYLLTHRLIEKFDDKIITKGDYNNIQDKEEENSNIEGKVVLVIPQKIVKLLIILILSIIVILVFFSLNNKKRNFIILLFLLIFILGSIGIFNTFSMYKFTNSINVNGSIAKPIFVIEKDDTITKENVSESNLVNDYSFKVKNYNNNEINEVELKYNFIIVDNNSEVDVTYKLYEVIDGIDNELNLNNNISDTFILGINNIQEKSYKLKLIANSGIDLENNDLSTNIKINFEQKE